MLQAKQAMDYASVHSVPYSVSRVNMMRNEVLCFKDQSCPFRFDPHAF